MFDFIKFSTTLLILFGAVTLKLYAQKKENTYTDVKPFTGSKEFRKFSIGLNAGVLAPSVFTGGSNDFTNPQSGLGYGANLRYQVTHYFAFQADALRGNLKGNQDKNIAGGGPPVFRPVQSFKTDLQWAGSVSGQFTFGNINWLRVKNTVVPYVSAGAGYASYKSTIIKTGTAAAVPYDENAIQEFYVPIALGFKINLTRLLNLDLGYRMHFVDGDNLDGSPYWFNNNSSTVKKDKFSYGFAGIEFSLGKKSRQQLLFDNPAVRTNNILQSQVNNLNVRFDSLAAAQKGLEDTDGDGVADIFDKEANTPEGSPVDAHGVTADTDGDGIPDYKDKQLITPTECQPVDADGVGRCPEPECCKTKSTEDSTCLSDYPSINFSGNSFQLSNDSRVIISTVSTHLKERPDCKIIIKGYPEASKSAQSVCQKRLDAIVKRLIETEGISADRISTNCEVGGGDKNTVDISAN